MDPAGAMHFYRNQADGGFRDDTEAAGLANMLGGLNLIQADYDNDGDLDILVLRGAWLGRDGQHPNSLLANDGRGEVQGRHLRGRTGGRTLPHSNRRVGRL